MEEMVLSNAVTGAEGVLECEAFKPSAAVPRDVIENDALALALEGGNAQELALYQVMNDLGPLATAKDIDAKDAMPKLGAAVWAAAPTWLASQSVETAAPQSLWCKAGA